MLKSLVKAFWLIAGLAISGAACAVGMGGITVVSALGEPLKAEIELVAVGKAEKGNLAARLASPDAFKGAGMDYPAGLPKLKFQIETRASGEPYLSVTSAQPLNEPFVSVLIELNWSSGKLLREYTFLLDPPEFRAEQPKAAEVKPVLGKAAEPAEPAAPPMQMRATAPLDEKAFAEAPSPARKPVASAPAAKTSESTHVATGTIKVKRGDTLSQIALGTKPADISLERMLLALYRANGDAFDGANMNRLKTGKILRLPEQADLATLTQVEAVKEFRAQVADWDAYRQKLAAAAGGTATGQTSRQEASGKISTAIADKSAAAQEPAKEVVRLSKGEAPGDKAVVSGNAKAMQEKIHTLEEEATARSKALKESNERVAMLEKNIGEMQRLLKLKAQPATPAAPLPGKAAAPAEAKPETGPLPPKAEAKPAAPAPVAASQPPSASAVATPAVVAEASSAVKPAKPASRSAAAPKVAPPPPSLLDEPLYLAGGAAALLALGGIGWMLARRAKGGKIGKKAPAAAVAAATDAGGATGQISTPVAPSPETGDFTQVAAAAPVSPATPEDVDPISEAELFLNFGRDAQAEEILKDALAKNPANNQVRLKLLTIYANRKDTNSFSVIARHIEASGDSAAWAQAAEMGRSLEPGNPTYGGTGEPAAAASAETGKSEQAASALDFDLGFGAPEAAAAAGSAAPESGTSPAGLDFDLGADESATPATSEYTSTLVLNLPADKPAGLDFDLGADESATPATSEYTSTLVLNLPADKPAGLDFDLGADETGASPAQDYTSTMVLNPQAGKKAATDLSSEITVINTSADLRAAQQEAAMDFDISASFPAIAAEPEKSNLDDLVFDVTSSQPVLAAPEDKAAENLPAGSDDKTIAFTLDFPSDSKPVAAPAQASAKEAVDFDLGSISLDLGAPPASAPAAQTRDAHWHDVATKLDLAKAYQEMGDNAGAREILEEVMAEGDEEQRATADAIQQQLLA
ncbi:MAG: hypothetical protein HZC43_12765 [Nitrosomonadales bacterium]|nr:hypothetical protein [Nitrosomonadales bacterium]